MFCDGSGEAYGLMCGCVSRGGGGRLCVCVCVCYFAREIEFRAKLSLTTIRGSVKRMHLHTDTRTQFARVRPVQKRVTRFAHTLTLESTTQEHTCECVHAAEQHHRQFATDGVSRAAHTHGGFLLAATTRPMWSAVRQRLTEPIGRRSA